MLTIRNMDRSMRPFVLATFPMVALLLAGAVEGGVFILLSLFYITGFVALADKYAPTQTTAAEDRAQDAHKVSVALAIAHFGVLLFSVWALAGERLSALEKLGQFMAAGLFMGQVSNANAHELIHRSKRGLHRLGMWVYISMLFGHHTSAHVLVHHTHVATHRDPNTSRRGEGFYRYAPRAWWGSFIQGYRAEAARLAKINRPAWRNPYGVYVGGAVLCISLAAWMGGAKAAILYVLLAGHAQMQLLMSDYVQHYGLTRGTDSNGKAQPVGPQHSWNSPHWLSSALMLNATRHSDHHAHPARAYPALTIPQDAPMLPKPLPVMASIALIPPLWRRIMDPLADRWRNA